MDKYGKDKVGCQRRSVTVSFGVEEVNGETNDQVMSFDVVPAFTKGDHYEIPDTARDSAGLKQIPIFTRKKQKKLKMPMMASGKVSFG